MPQFVLEIGTEEMPARFVPSLANELENLFRAELEQAKLDFGKVWSFATPRRVAVNVMDLAEKQRVEDELVIGPPKRIAVDEEGTPTKAGLGFAKSQGVDFADVFITDTGKGEYLALRKQTGGKEAIEVLSALCPNIVSKLSFPKKMRWADGEFAFGRPLRWILALLDRNVVPFSVGDVSSGRITRGHRILGTGPFEAVDPESYFTILREQSGVVISVEDRKAAIRSEGDHLAQAIGGSIVWKDSLMNEVANLVEHPKPIMGAIDEIYLELPREVLLTSMESHQKSFGVEDAQRQLLPNFLTVLNITSPDEDLVRKGWERVLKARLEDARFFWLADTKVEFETWRKKLDKVTFLAALGSMGAKADRLECLCGQLAEKVLPDARENMVRAGRYAKCDLVSEMVNEFDSLQGKMGGIYARKSGMDETVAQALYEQYLPAGPESPVPSSKSGAVLSMADKADTLVGCFGLDMIPTGGADPYALRRSALGIVRIVLEHGLRLSLSSLLKKARQAYGDAQWKLSGEEAHDKLMDFFAQRLKAFYTGHGFSTLVVEACLGAGFDDLHVLDGRIKALEAFSKEEGFEASVLTFKRAANIIRKQGEEAGVKLDGQFDPLRFEEAAERALAATLEEVAPRFERYAKVEKYEDMLGELAILRPHVDTFFDNVMVMCDDVNLRTNRLNLLQSLVEMLSQLADFNALQV